MHVLSSYIILFDRDRALLYLRKLASYGYNVACYCNNLFLNHLLSWLTVCNSYSMAETQLYNNERLFVKLVRCCNRTKDLKDTISLARTSKPFHTT